jgi:hypothetical protein
MLRTFLQRQGKYVQLNFITYGGAELANLTMEEFLEGFQANGMFSWADVQRRGLAKHMPFFVNSQNFANRGLQGTRDAVGRGGGVIADSGGKRDTMGQTEQYLRGMTDLAGHIMGQELRDDPALRREWSQQMIADSESWQQARKGHATIVERTEQILNDLSDDSGLRGMLIERGVSTDTITRLLNITREGLREQVFRFGNGRIEAPERYLLDVNSILEANAPENQQVAVLAVDVMEELARREQPQDPNAPRDLVNEYVLHTLLAALEGLPEGGLTHRQIVELTDEYLYRDTFQKDGTVAASIPSSQTPLGKAFRQIIDDQVAIQNAKAEAKMDGLRILSGAAAKHVISPEVAEQAASLDQSQWILIHSSALLNAPDGPATLARIQEQLAEALHGGQSAVRFALVVDGAQDAEQAEDVARILQDAAGSDLARSRFDLVFPGTWAPGHIQIMTQLAVPGGRIAAVVGPEEWVHGMRQASTDPSTVASIVVGSAQPGQAVLVGPALVVAVEAAIRNGKAPEDLIAKMNTTLEGDDVLAPVIPVDLSLNDALEAYRRKLQDALATAGHA